MKRRLTTLHTLTLSCLILCSQLSFAAKPLVILLSWDGMRHDYPDLDVYPGLKRLENEGLRAASLIPGFPSSTFPGHVTLATGAEPEVHGILNNKFFDREKGAYSYGSDANWIEAEPLWITTERQGIKSATYFWVGSETDWRGQAASYRMAPFDDSRSAAEKVDKILEWIDLPEAERPQLIMSYWMGADKTAHVYGPDNDKVRQVIVEEDKQLQRLLNALDERELWQSTTLILVSDHGMTVDSESAQFKTALEESGIAAKSYGGPTIQHIFVDRREDIDAVYNLISKLPNLKAYKQDQLPEKYHFNFPSRTGDIVVTVEPPYSLLRPDTFIEKAQDMIMRLLGDASGTHGYDPALADMQGIFFAMGRGVNSSRKLESVRQLDVAPTITRLLEIDPPLNASGKPIPLN